MYNNEALLKLRRQLLKLVNLKINGSPVLTGEEKNQIRKLLEGFSNEVNTLQQNHELFNQKFESKFSSDTELFLQNSKRLEEYHIESIKNITEIHDKQILNSNHKINILQSRLKNNVVEIALDYENKETLISKSIPTIEEALEENKKHFNSFYNSYQLHYADVIQKTNKASDDLIERIHSENSRKTIFLDEEDDLKRLNINNQIKTLEAKIEELESELKQRLERLKSKALAESVELNKQIKILTDNKNRNLQIEKDKNKIKINDLNTQLSNHQAEFNSKTKKTISLFIDKLADLDKIDSKISAEYNKNIEETKRNYFYDYYSTLLELNSYISAERNNTKVEALALKRANKKLYRLRIKSYYEKLRDLKLDYEMEIKAYQEKFKLDSKKIASERELAEINKNHEVEIANLEFNTKKDNIKILSNFINSQEYLRSIKINDVFNKDAAYKRMLSLKNVEHLQRKIEHTTAKYNINIANIKAKVHTLKTELNLLNDLEDLRHITSEDKYTTTTKLIRIITMLDLDKNKLLNDFNKAQATHYINRAKLISLKQKRINDINLEFLGKYKDIKENYETILFQIDANRYKHKIDTHNWYKKYSIQNETNLFSKRKSLLDLKDERRIFRLNTIKCVESGKLYSNLLSASISFGNDILDVIKNKISDYDAPTTTLALKFIDIISDFQRATFIDFNSLETNLIENKINEITQYKYNDSIQEIKEDYSKRNQDVNNNIKSLLETTNKYRETRTKYTNQIYDLELKLKRIKEDPSFSPFFNKSYSNLKRAIKDLKIKVKEIKNKQDKIDNYILINRNYTYRLEKKYRDDLKQIEKRKKHDYKSYYDLINKANRIKDNTVKKMNKLYSLTTTISGEVRFASNSQRVYENSSKYLTETFEKYNQIFNKFKKENENEFKHYYHQIINQFRIRNLKLNYEKNKKFKFLNDKNHDKIVRLNDSKLELEYKLKNLKSIYNLRVQKVNDEHNRYLTDEQNIFNQVEIKFHQESWAVTNNISYLRNKANEYIKSLDKKYYSNYTAIELKHKETIKKINRENSMYVANKENYLSTILLNEKRNISEIESNSKDEIQKIVLNMEENNHDSQVIKRKYKSEKVRIITNSTNKLLASRIEHNKTIKNLTKNKK